MKNEKQQQIPAKVSNIKKKIELIDVDQIPYRASVDRTSHEKNVVSFGAEC